jgi:predicted acetyltransferase
MKEDELLNIEDKTWLKIRFPEDMIDYDVAYKLVSDPRKLDRKERKFSIEKYGSAHDVGFKVHKKIYLNYSGKNRDVIVREPDEEEWISDWNVGKASIIPEEKLNNAIFDDIFSVTG